MLRRCGVCASCPSAMQSPGPRMVLSRWRSTVCTATSRKRTRQSAGPRPRSIRHSRPKWTTSRRISRTQRRRPGDSDTAALGGGPHRLRPGDGARAGGTRRALVVSYEPFHRSVMASVCPITSRQPKYPGEVPSRSATPVRPSLASSSATRSERSLWTGSPRSNSPAVSQANATDPGIRGGVRCAGLERITSESDSRQTWTAPHSAFVQAPADTTAHREARSRVRSKRRVAQVAGT